MHQNKKFKAYNFEQSLNRGTKIEYSKKVATKNQLVGEGGGLKSHPMPRVTCGRGM